MGEGLEAFVLKRAGGLGILLWSLVGSPAFLIPNVYAQGTYSASFVPAEDLFRARVEERLARVREFEAIKKWAEARGVRAWVAGGSAAGFLHTVRDELESESLLAEGKDPGFFASRFTYAYFDLYRHNQDADIVIDADEATAIDLEAYLNAEFSYLRAKKSVWEVRLLNRSRGKGLDEKDPILGWDFQHQHTDSHSTGMMELTTPPPGESRVRDSFQWGNQTNPQFFEDVLKKEVHFYYGVDHQATKRAKNRWNPEILAVIRLFMKSFQYGLSTSPETLALVQPMITRFNPTDAAYSDSYVRMQIVRNALKLFWHAEDVELAWTMLTRTGLRDKLIQFAERYGYRELKIWMEKEPLTSFNVGGGKGRTAKELGLNVIAHDTRSYEAFESILRSRKGRPNVFESREDRKADGELARYGQGFYTMRGDRGFHGSGITIRFELLPEAREGHDFTYFHQLDIVLVLNRNAIRVIDDEAAVFTLPAILAWLDSNATVLNEGMLQRMRLKLKSKLLLDNDPEVLGAVDYLKKSAAALLRKRKTVDVHSPLTLTLSMQEWLKLDPAPRFPELISLFARISERVEWDIYHEPAAFFSPAWNRWFETKLAAGIPDLYPLLKHPEIFKHESWVKWVEAAFSAKFGEGNLGGLLSDPRLVGNHEHAAHPLWLDWFKASVESAYHNPDWTVRVLLDPNVMNSKFWLDAMNWGVRAGRDVMTQVLSDPEARGMPEWPNLVGDWLRHLKESTSEEVTRVFLSIPELVEHPDYWMWMRRAVWSPRTCEVAVKEGLSLPWVVASPNWASLIDDALERCPAAVVNHLFAKGVIQPGVNGDRWMDWLTEDRARLTIEVLSALSLEPWSHSPRFLDWFKAARSVYRLRSLRLILLKDWVIRRPDWEDLFFETTYEAYFQERMQLSDGEIQKAISLALPHHTMERFKARVVERYAGTVWATPIVDAIDRLRRQGCEGYLLPFKIIPTD